MREMADIKTLNQFMWQFQRQRDKTMEFLKTVKEATAKGYDITSMVAALYQEMGDEIQGTDYCFHNKYDWTEVVVLVDPELSLVDDKGMEFDPNPINIEIIDPF
ncbi:MAG: hypothetical protein ABFD08_15265 [Syntrophomonas sp.]